MMPPGIVLDGLERRDDRCFRKSVFILYLYGITHEEILQAGVLDPDRCAFQTGVDDVVQGDVRLKVVVREAPTRGGGES